MLTSSSRKIRSIALATALLVTASAGALSSGPFGDREPRHMLIHMTDRLELSHSQQQQIEALLTQSRSNTGEDKARMEALKASLHAMRADFDPGEAEAVATELGELSGRIALERASTRADIYELLTPRQRDTMAELEAMRDKRKQRTRPGS